eukprot:1001904-Pelagomonas_calceolata.AAC.2
MPTANKMQGIAHCHCNWLKLIDLVTAFASHAELSYAKRKKKLLYVVPMAEEWEDPTTDVLLGMIQKGGEWATDRDVVPKRIVNDIVGILKRPTA